MHTHTHTHSHTHYRVRNHTHSFVHVYSLCVGWPESVCIVTVYCVINWTVWYHCMHWDRGSASPLSSCISYSILSSIFWTPQDKTGLRYPFLKQKVTSQPIIWRNCEIRHKCHLSPSPFARNSYIPLYTESPVFDLPIWPVVCTRIHQRARISLICFASFWRRRRQLFSFYGKWVVHAFCPLSFKPCGILMSVSDLSCVCHSVWLLSMCGNIDLCCWHASKMYVRCK